MQALLRVHDGARPRRAHGAGRERRAARRVASSSASATRSAPRYNAYRSRRASARCRRRSTPATAPSSTASRAEWRGMRDLAIHVVGHSDQTPIAARNRARVPRQLRAVARRARRRSPTTLRAACPIAARRRSKATAPTSRSPTGTSPRASRSIVASRSSRRPAHVAAAEWRIVTASAQSAAVATIGAVGSGDARAAARARVDAAARRQRRARARDRHRDARSRGSRSCSRATASRRRFRRVRIAIAHLPTQQVRAAINGRRRQPAELRRHRAERREDRDREPLARRRSARRREPARRDRRRRRRQRGAVLERTVHYGGGAVRAELVRRGVDAHRRRPHAARRSRCACSTRRASRRGPARSARIASRRRIARGGKSRSLNDNQLLVEGTREPTFASTTTAWCASCSSRRRRPAPPIVRLRFNERQEQEIRVWLEPRAARLDPGRPHREHGRVRDDQRQHAVRAERLEEGYSSDGRVAFFAKGAIKGEYLLTIAYDSARDHALAKDRLLGTIEPDRYYTLYGDAIEQRFEAATTRKLYREARAAPVRRAVRRLRDRPDADGARRATAVRSRASSPTTRGERFGVQRVRRRESRAGLRQRRAAGRRHLGPVSAVAPAARREQRQVAARGARPLPQRGRGRVAAAHARSSTTASTISTARCSSSSRCRAATRTSTRCTSSPSTRVLDGGEGGMTAGARATAQLAGDKLEIGAS